MNVRGSNYPFLKLAANRGKKHIIAAVVVKYKLPIKPRERFVVSGKDIDSGDPLLYYPTFNLLRLNPMPQ